MRVPYLDLKVTNKRDLDSLSQIFKKILQNGKIIEGPELFNFEKKISNYLNTKYAIGISSGSSALYLALKSLNIGKGDEVITTPFSWIITSNAIMSLGATPVFADILDDFNISPVSIQKLISKKTKAIVPMHLAGHMCKMNEISKIARSNKLYIVEDAAQAISASLYDKKAGYWSNVAAFSMNPMKTLSAYGEAGLITTNYKKKFETIKRLRHAGTKKDVNKININQCIDISLNHKMDTIQAAFLNYKLFSLDKKRNIREKISNFYDDELKNFIKFQKISKNEVHGRYMYIFTCEKRNRLRSFLESKNIETKIFYSPLIPNSNYYKKYNFKFDDNNSSNMLKTSLSIPMHENLKTNQIEFVIDNIKKFYKDN